MLSNTKSTNCNCIDISDTYSVVLTSMLCLHKDTKEFPLRCFAYGFDEDGCKEECSTHSSCIGFSNAKGYGGRCWLMVSQAACPENWSLQSGKAALNGNDLAGGGDYGASCFAKIPGNL